MINDISLLVQRVLSEKCPGVRYEFRQRLKPTMLAIEVTRKLRIVKSLNKAYMDVRGEEQPTGVLELTCFYGSDAGHLYKQLGMEGIFCGLGGKYNT